MIDEVFRIFDKDNSKTIEKDEAIKHWSKNFGRISANEFFNTVDYNHDGQIQYEEFMDFWMIVKGTGHSEDEIRDEVSEYFPTPCIPIQIIFNIIVGENKKWRDLDRI